MNVEHKDYRIFPAKYAKRQFVISPTPDGSGFKTRAGRLAEAVGGRWVNRSRGYHVSEVRAQRFIRLFEEGWDASTYNKALIPPQRRT